MKKVYIIFLALVFCAVNVVLSYAAENKGEGAKPEATPPGPMAGPGAPGTPPHMSSRPNFSMVAGTITKIDASDPANIKLEVQNEMDGKIHVVSLTQWTNITKVTDVSELKAGDSVRIMARKIDENNEVAMGVMFGNLKKMPIPRPMMTGQAVGPGAKAPPAQAKKAQANKK